MKRTFIFLLAILCQVCVAQSKPIASLPFTVEKNCIYFYAKVNKTDSIKFLFDTGADGSVINKQSLNKLQLNLDGKSLNQGSNGTNEVVSSSKNEITIGNITKKDVMLTVIPYETNNFDGVFGTNLMEGYIIEIDYDKKVMNFYAKDEGSVDYKNYVKMKLHSKGYPTTVKSSIIVNGKKYTGFFGLDTGADDALTLASPFAKKNDFLNKLPKIGSAGFQGSDGSEYEMPIVLLTEIIFAGKHLYRLPVSLSNAKEGIDATEQLAGFFGNAFLKKFNLILDYDNRTIYFKLNKNLYKEYYE